MYVKRYAGSVPVNYNGTVFNDTRSDKVSQNNTKIHKIPHTKQEGVPKETVPKDVPVLQDQPLNEEACLSPNEPESKALGEVKESDKEELFDKPFIKNILKSLSAQDILLGLGLFLLLNGELEDESLLLIAALIALGK